MARTDFPLIKNVVSRIRQRKVREKFVDHAIDATMMGVGDTVRDKVGDALDLKLKKPR